MKPALILVIPLFLTVPLLAGEAGGGKAPPAGDPAPARPAEPKGIETPEIVRILEEESIKSVSTRHSQVISITLTDGRRFFGQYVHAEAGKYAKVEKCFDILNLVVYIKERRPKKETQDWGIACE